MNADHFCGQCGKLYVPKPEWKTPKYCSERCKNKAAGVLANQAKVANRVALERDAARYRYLRDDPRSYWGDPATHPYVVLGGAGDTEPIRGGRLDTAIDAVLAGECDEGDGVHERNP
jgi:hypothetical protein